MGESAPDRRAKGLSTQETIRGGRPLGGKPQEDAREVQELSQRLL